MNEQVAEVIAEPMDDVRESVRQAREMIPITATGVAPLNFAQQIDYAQTMAKARAAIPEHLQGNVGDCLAVIDISTRAGLSPYMVAGKTYVQNKRLCFESQLFHAFAQASGLLSGDLQVEYEGEGEETTCIVTGFLRGDQKPRIHRSEPLKTARPKRNEQGVVKGSPLWDKKPKVQLFYDTSRDWVRMFAPRATLGIYTPEEIEEYGPDMARDVTPSPGLHTRLAGSSPGAEGHKAGHAASELDQVAAEPPPASTEKAADDAAGEKNKKKITAKNSKPEPQAPEQPKPDAPAEQVPTKATEYVPYATAWIAAAIDANAMDKRWASERKLRNSCGVTSDDRLPLESMMIDRRKAIEAKP